MLGGKGFREFVKGAVAAHDRRAKRTVDRFLATHRGENKSRRPE